ncbi:phosphotransferase [Candidatus Poribacteria bacterium]
MDTVCFNRAVEEQFGIRVTKLYALDTRGTEDIVKVAALENHTAEWNPPEGARWVKREALDDFPIISPILSQVLAAWFAKEAEEASLMPWSKTGWFDEAAAWILAQLRRLGMTVRSPVEQVKSFYTGGTLRVNTDAGYVYLKALPQVFVRELETIQMLAKWIPEHVPVILASDPERRWMLLQGIGGVDLTEISDLEVWEDVLRVYAQLQVTSLSFVDELLNGPLYDYRIQSMASAIDSVLMDAPSLLQGYQEPLSDVELKQLLALSPQLEALCVEVESYGIPCALEHGDLHAGNIRITANGPVFYDWAWSYVTHPFLGPIGFLYKAGKSLPVISNARERLRDVYLEAWTDYESIDRLRELFDLIDRWRILHAVLIDAEWVSVYQKKLSGPPIQCSFTEWALRRRQYYLAKVLRRLPGSVLL